MHQRTDVAEETALPSEAPGARSVEHLENCIRDLLRLLALPALWTGREPKALLTLLCEALEAMLPIAACHARCDTFGTDNRCEVMRVANAEIAPDSAEWEALRAACSATQSAQNVTIATTPNGALRLVRLDMDFHVGGGSLCVASADSGFPSDTQYAYLRAATSLAATGLHNAKLAREREEASRAKDEFLAMLGHELRNPLAPIVTALAIVKLRGKGQLDREHEIIERQVHYLTRLVDDLLDVARVHARQDRVAARDGRDCRDRRQGRRDRESDARAASSPPRGRRCVVGASRAWRCDPPRADLRQPAHETRRNTRQMAAAFS